MDKDKKQQIRNQKEIEKYEAEILNSIRIFISSSRTLLDILHTLSTDKKKTVTLNIAELTKQCSEMSKKRCLQIAEGTLMISQRRLELEQNDYALSQLNTHKNEYTTIQYFKKKSQIKCKIKDINKHISDLQDIISVYQAEVDTYKNALNICSEFARRLKFYLSCE